MTLSVYSSCSENVLGNNKSNTENRFLKKGTRVGFQDTFTDIQTVSSYMIKTGVTTETTDPLTNKLSQTRIFLSRIPIYDVT